MGSGRTDLQNIQQLPLAGISCATPPFSCFINYKADISSREKRPIPPACGIFSYRPLVLLHRYSYSEGAWGFVCTTCFRSGLARPSTCAVLRKRISCNTQHLSLALGRSWPVRRTVVQHDQLRHGCAVSSGAADVAPVDRASSGGAPN